MSPTDDRQHIVRVPGARRAKLTPVPGTDVDPDLPQTDASPAAEATGDAGPNDERMRQDVPPHY